MCQSKNSFISCVQIVVVGDGASGKTSICQRFAKETFEKTYHQVRSIFRIPRFIRFSDPRSGLLLSANHAASRVAGASAGN